MADVRVTVGVAKRIMGGSDDHIRRLCEDGALDAVDIRRPGAARARWSIARASIEAFMRDRSNRHASGERKSR